MWSRGHLTEEGLPESQEFAIRVDRLRENDLVVGPNGWRFSGRRHRRQRDLGDGRERRIVRRGRVHFHLVADRQGRVQRAAQHRALPAEVNSAVLGRRLTHEKKKNNHII
jgi:hypothetical protein